MTGAVNEYLCKPLCGKHSRAATSTDSAETPGRTESTAACCAASSTANCAATSVTAAPLLYVRVESELYPGSTGPPMSDHTISPLSITRSETS